jgi:putative spermidine/putrescine transport system permease protein
MITQIIIEQVQTLLNWGFAGAVSMLLLAATVITLLIYNRVLGLATLTGGSTSGARPRTGVMAKAGAALLGFLGDTCDRAAWLLEQLPRLRRHAHRQGLSGGSRLAALLLLAFLALPTLFVVPIPSASAFIDGRQPLSLLVSADLGVAVVTMTAIARVGIAVAICAIATPHLQRRLVRRRQGPSRIISVSIVADDLPHLIIAVARFILRKDRLIGTSPGW